MEVDANGFRNGSIIAAMKILEALQNGELVPKRLFLSV